MINYVVTSSGSWLCMSQPCLCPQALLLCSHQLTCLSPGWVLEEAKLLPAHAPCDQVAPPGTLCPTPSLLSSEVSFQCSFYRRVFLCLSAMNLNYIIQMLLFFSIARIINSMTCLFNVFPPLHVK